MIQPPDDVLEELTKHVDLGHAARDSAFLRQVALVCSNPGASSPQAAGKAVSQIPMNDLISLYRFVANEKVSIADLRETRAKTVLASVPSDSEVLIVHDMSPLDYSRHNSKEDRRPIGDNRGMGYEYVACLAVDPESSTSLGVIHDTVISAEGPDDKDTMDYDYEPLFEDFSEKETRRLQDNHRHQMAVHVNGLKATLGNRHPIHVADCEFDDIFILDRCIQNDHDFVIRSSGNRNVQIPRYDWLPEKALAGKQSGHPIPEGYVYANLARVVDSVPLQPYKTLPLDSRQRVVDPASAKRYADLSIGAFRVRLYRDAKRNKQPFRPPRPVELNVVVIRETDPPPGEDALLWVLFTSLSVNTFEKMTSAGHIYELRWSVETYFRLLKSGYNIEKSRLDNAEKVARWLVVVSLAALTVLTLKMKLGLPSKGALASEDYQRVKTAMLEPENPDIDINLRLFAFVAKSGGWLGRKRDPIGPTVLMRGMLHFFAALDTFTRFQALFQQVIDNPDVLRRLFCV
jgi:hypothetical protein